MTKAIPSTVFASRFPVLRIHGRLASLRTTLRLTAALRGLLLRECPEQPPPEWFSGHTPDGRPTKHPHMALAPLPLLDSEHRDGRIMGFAVILPNRLRARDIEHYVEPIFRDPYTRSVRAHRLFAGRWGDCKVRLESRSDPPWTLNPQAWTGGNDGSPVWASVTPVVLNRHFDGPDRWARAAESLKSACNHIGLPRPRDIRLHRKPVVGGIPAADRFTQTRRKADRGRSEQRHALLTFDEPIRGPVLLGAGRFRGYGLFSPLSAMQNVRSKN